MPAHELLELLTAGAAGVVVRRDGCEQRGTATGHLVLAAHILATAGVPRLRLEEAGRPTPDDEVARGGGRSGLWHRVPRTLRRDRRHVSRDVLDAARMPVPRRQLLGLRSGPTRTLPDQLVPAPRRLHAALAALLPLDVRAGLDAAAVPDAAVRLGAQGCTACGVCVRACPTDALNLQSFGGTTGSTLVTSLLHDPVSCDGCRRCVEMCPADVLTVTGTWGTSAVLSLVERPEPAPVASLSTTECLRCRTRFPTTDAANLCPVCTFRSQNPFSSSLPPGRGARG